MANEALVRLYAGVYDNDAELFALETEAKGILTKALEYAENVESDLRFCRDVQGMQVPMETIKDAKALTLLLKEAQKNCPECRLFQGQSNNKARDRNGQKNKSKAPKAFSVGCVSNSPVVVSDNGFR